MDQLNCLEENPPQYGMNPKGGEKLIRDLRRNSDGSQPTDATMGDREARNDFWSIEGSHIHRHRVEPRIQLYLPKKESFLIPLKYIDVSRTARTNMGVMQESRIDDYWNIDANRNISEPWTRFMQFTISNEKPLDGYIWSGKCTRPSLTSS